MGCVGLHFSIQPTCINNFFLAKSGHLNLGLASDSSFGKYLALEGFPFYDTSCVISGLASLCNDLNLRIHQNTSVQFTTTASIFVHSSFRKQSGDIKMLDFEKPWRRHLLRNSNGSATNYTCVLWPRLVSISWTKKKHQTGIEGFDFVLADPLHKATTNAKPITFCNRQFEKKIVWKLEPIKRL